MHMSFGSKRICIANYAVRYYRAQLDFGAIYVLLYSNASGEYTLFSLNLVFIFVEFVRENEELGIISEIASLLNLFEII